MENCAHNFFSTHFNASSALLDFSLIPPNPTAPHFPDMAKAEFLLPLSVQRSREHWKSSAWYGDVLPERKIQILRNREMHTEMARRARRRRELEREDLKKQITAALKSPSDTLKLVEFCIANQLPVTARLRPVKSISATENLPSVSGVPITFSRNWDMFVQTPTNLIFVRGSEIVSISQCVSSLQTQRAS